MAVLYKVSTWDHEKQRWAPYVTRTRLRGLRKILRSLYRHGWDTPSVLVERRDGDTSGMRDRTQCPPPKRLKVFAGD